jgi:serine/threonine-protein kinase
VIDIGSVVNGKYRLTRLLGDGGMGSVYEAQHTVLGTRVAIKVLHPELARRTGLVERFLQEARVAAQIRSPHVVQVTDVDRTPDGHAYIVMELLEGEPLSSVLDRQRKLPVPQASEYTLQILEALDSAHALGVIHRDLKPENVFVTFAGGKPVLKLIDFGIAKARRTDPQQKNLTVAGVVMGTAEYMAPEQARSAGEVDARADIYAVGVMLYEMIAGSRPVSGDDARIIALKVERGEIIPIVQAAPDVPRELAGLVHRAMAPRPELRFATATEMRLALERAANARRPTGAMAAQGGGGAPPAAPSGPELTPTGTLKQVHAAQVLGAAYPGAQAQHQAPAPAPPEAERDAPVHTERAPPIATALAAPVYAGTPMPQTPAPYVDEPRRRGGGGGRIAALIALPLLLGAGIVMVLVGTGTWALSSTPPEPPPLPTSTSTPDAGSGSATTATAATSSPVPTLLPTRPTPPTPTPHPTPSGHPTPPGGEDAGQNPFPPFPSTLPSVLPPFPSVLPPFPSGFPTSFPSGFPSVLPPWPPPPGPNHP